MTTETVHFTGQEVGFNFHGQRGLRCEIDDRRSVAVHHGTDDDGNERWAVRLVNGDHTTTFGLSDEAMDAMVGMFVQIVKDMPTAQGATA